MQYLALLIDTERELTPDERAEGMAAYQSFHAKAGPAIRAGDALLPSATGARIAGGPEAPMVTDGPFAEAAEIACGYYVFEAENLDDALTLARGIPAAQHGAIEVRPIVHTIDEGWSRNDAGWLALLLETPENANTPGTPEWEAEAGRHGEFAAAPLWIEDVAVDHQTGILSKCDCRLILEGHLHPRLGSRAEFATHLHEGPDDGGGSAHLRLIFDLRDHTHRSRERGLGAKS